MPEGGEAEAEGRERSALPEISLPDDHIATQLAVRVEPGEDSVLGRMQVRSSMWGIASKRPRLSLFAMAIDTLSGFLPFPVHVPTVGLRAQFLTEPPSEGPVEFHGRPLRVGGRLIVSEFEVRGEDGNAFGRGITTMSNNPFDGWTPESSVEPADPIASFDDLLSVRVVDERTLELDPADRIANGLVKTPHGGAQMLFCELAAEHLATHPRAATDIDVHFLRPGEAGPLRATATRVGTVTDTDVVRVDLTDVGADHALVAAVTVMSRPVEGNNPDSR